MEALTSSKAGLTRSGGVIRCICKATTMAPES
jgi:hypothetical protein